MSLLEIDGIVKEYDQNTILDEVSLRIDRGSKVALVGSNGAGKTTLLRIICGYERPDLGRINFASGIRIGYLSQHLEDMAALDETPLLNPELTKLEEEMKRFADEIAKGSADAISKYEHATAKYEAMGGYSIQYRMAETLSGLGLPADAISRPVSSFSGGERMRVALARLLVLGPDLLLLDEPTNHLDLEGIEWLEEYLRSFKGGVLTVSHDRYFLDRVSDRVASLEGGKLKVMSGGYTDFIIQAGIERDFEEKEIQRLRQEVARQQEIAQTLRSHRKMASYHSRQRVVIKLSEKLEEVKKRSASRKSAPLKISISESEGYSREVLSFSNLSKSFDEKVIFSDLELKVKAGDKVAVVGPNGCGKTTLINLIMGWDSEFSGYLKVGAWVRVGHMGQNISFSSNDATLVDEIMAAGSINEEAARNYLASYGFRNKDVFKEIGVLSGGERSRLYLACMLLENPDCLILDEPTNHLDTASREILEDALIKFSGTVIAASHDRYFLRKCFTKIAAFTGGTLKEFESYESFRSYKAGDMARTLTRARKGTTVGAEAGMKIGTTVGAEAGTGTGLNTSKSSQNTTGNDICTNTKDLRKQGRTARAEERRIAAERRTRIKELEEEIKVLEENKHKVEQGFDKETALSEYEEYDRLLVRLESIYSEYIQLAEEHEDS